MKILFIGEAPSKSDAKTFEGQCSKRLSELCGKDWREVAHGINVFDMPLHKAKGAKEFVFDVDAGRKALKRKLGFDGHPHATSARKIVFLGKRVAAAAGFTELDFFQRSAFVNGNDQVAEVTVIPHPSSINRFWDDATTRSIVQDFVQHFIRDDSHTKARAK